MLLLFSYSEKEKASKNDLVFSWLLQWRTAWPSWQQNYLLILNDCNANKINNNSNSSQEHFHFATEKIEFDGTAGVREMQACHKTAQLTSRICSCFMDIDCFKCALTSGSNIFLNILLALMLYRCKLLELCWQCLA